MSESNNQPNQSDDYTVLSRPSKPLVYERVENEENNNENENENRQYIDLTDKDAWDDSELIQIWDTAKQEFMDNYLHGNPINEEDSWREKNQNKKKKKKNNKKSVPTKVETQKNEDEIDLDDLDGEDDTANQQELNPQDEPAKKRKLSHTTDSEPVHVPPVEESNPIHQTYDNQDETDQAENQNEELQNQTFNPFPGGQEPMDDSLMNLLMSWYYAGYYTGLYQAKRQ